MGKPKGIRSARKLRTDRRVNRWADKKYKKAHLGTWLKANPFGGASHARGIVVERVGIEAKQPNSAIRKCVRVQLMKNGKRICAFVPRDGCLNFIDENDEVLIAGFGRKGHAVGDIPGVRFKVVQVAKVSLIALFREPIQSVLWAPPCLQSEPCSSRMESPPSTPLTLVPARRRRHEDGERSRRRRGSRSRDRRRQSPPPADWRGPAEGWRPPQEWAGYAPPNHGGHMGWPPPQRPMYRPPGYGPWGVPPPREAMDWRPGAASGTPALPGAPGTWTPPGPAPPNHWGGGPPSHWGGPSAPTPFAKGPFEQSPAPAVVENGHSAGAVPATAEPALVEEPLPPAPTASERLRSVRLVSSALSEQMLEKLHSLGVMPKKGKELVEKVPEAGFRSDLASGAQCDLLGLGFGSTPLGSAQKLPAPAGKRRVPATPVCTLGLAPGGLWERFRQRCGTPWPPEPPVFIPQLRSSKAGGHAVVLAVRGETR